MIPHWLEETIAPLEKRLSKHPRSPLFAQLAGFYLEAGKPQDALRVCDEGLAQHPMYTTGHLMKGKALVALKMMAEAHREFEIVRSVLPGVESVERLLAESGGAGDVLTSTAAPSPQTPELVVTAPSSVEEPTPVAETAVSSEDSFGGGAPTTEELSPMSEPPVEATGVAQEAGGEETLEAFSARMRGELAGTEDTLTLDDYFSGAAGAPTAAAGSQIEDLAQKLQGAKITPVINLPTRPSESDAGGAGAGFVTPTLAEIYVKQGWFDDAIRAYKSLATTKPDEKEKFEQRILEIEDMKRRQGG